MVEVKKRKVLLFAKSIDGGTGTIAISLQKLKLHGYEVVTYILERPSKRKINSKNMQYVHGKDYYPYRYSITLSGIGSFLWECLWFRRKCVEEKPTIILSLDVHCNLIAVICKLSGIAGPSYVLTTHINLRDTLRDKGTFLLGRIMTGFVSILYNKADLLIASTQRMKLSLRNDFGIRKKIVVIPYGITTKGLRLEKVHSRVKTILSIGRMVEQKDFFTLIDAYEKVRKKYDKCRLVIIGDGPLRKSISKRVRQSTFADSISLIGWKDRTPEWIAKADIFTLTSRREGFPIVILEAIVVGTPIVATDAPFGPSEMLGRGRYGLLARVGDSSGVARAILRLLNDKKLYDHFVKQLRQRGMSYSEDRMLYSYAKTIHGSLGKSS